MKKVVNQAVCYLFYLIDNCQLSIKQPFVACKMVAVKLQYSKTYL